MVGLFFFFKHPIGRKAILKLIYPVPVIKNLLHLVDVARFCRVFSTLMASAVPIIDSLEITLDSLKPGLQRNLQAGG
jgi:type IV pilus assembly protein PilC